MSDSSPLILLRHGEVASHKGDVPVTPEGLEIAVRTGKAIGAAHTDPITVLYGGTRRSRETAEAIIEGIGDPSRVDGPIDAFALRNPDIFVSGVRVNMVSSASTLAEQVPGLTEEQAEQNAFFSTFFYSPDRIAWWLDRAEVPGDTADDLVRRIQGFARSIADPGPLQGRLVVGITHSPLLRSILRDSTGADPGEPPYVTGAAISIGTDGELTVMPHDPLST